MSRRLPRRSLATALAIAITTFSSGALAWGPEGHAIVADIATWHLTPQAMKQIQQLLALEGHTRLDQISSWADEHRRDHPESGPWHYVDIPVQDAAYAAARDCHDDDCVVARIPYFAKILGNAGKPAAERLEALKYLVHFVGDIHQPLHTADNHDKGGNDVKLVYFGYLTNLHAMWDGQILEHALGLHTGPDYSFDALATEAAAGKLDARITDAERTDWAPVGMMQNLPKATVQWANQSHALAADVAYGYVPENPQYGWSEVYQARTWPVVRQQLERGGVRLAAILNAELK